MRKPVQVYIYVDDGCWAGVAILIKEFLTIAGTLPARSSDLHKSELFHVSMIAPGDKPVRSFTGTCLTPDAS
jgi:hypothetical protein